MEPFFYVRIILKSIQSLLAAPNPNRPNRSANAEATRLFLENKTEYNILFFCLYS